jgi:hypothetical protein
MCKRRFTTYEIPEGQYTVLQDMGKRLASLSAAFSGVQTMAAALGHGGAPPDPLADDGQREVIRQGICRRFRCDGACEPEAGRKCDRALSQLLYTAGLS